MDILTALLYTSVVILVYKVFKVKPTKWNVTTSAIIGFVLLGGIFTGMAYFHPYSEKGRRYFVSVPIVSEVRGLVQTVDAKPNSPIKKGDILFTIDPTPFQAKVDKLQANLDFAILRYNESKALSDKDAGPIYDVELYESQIDELQAQLDIALFNLKMTKVRAPSDGMITQMRVRPGMMTVPLPLVPLVEYIPKESPIYAAGFRQVTVRNIEPGFRVEVIFPSLPGRVFRGNVKTVLPAIGEGELQGTARLQTTSRGPMYDGRYSVTFSLDEPIDQYNLPLGSACKVAVYSDHLEFLGIIRQVLLRMVSWKHLFYFEEFAE